MDKGVSELISVVIIIGIIVTIAGLVGPWAMNFSRRQVSNTEGGVENQISCQNTAYDFDASYGNSGADWDFSGADDWLRAKVVNTGSINLNSFSFQIYVQGLGYRLLTVKNAITPESPLKPGQSGILEADIKENLAGQLTEVRVLNGVCKTFILTQEF
jgi:flagellin-like protein